MSRLTDSEWRVLTALWDSGDAALGEVAASCARTPAGAEHGAHLSHPDGAQGAGDHRQRALPPPLPRCLSRGEGRTEERRSFLSRVSGSAGTWWRPF